AAPEAPLPGPEARDPAPQRGAALAGDRQLAAADGGAGLHRVPDADPDGVLARGGARLSRSLAPARGQVLCAAPGAAAVQAAADGGGVRPLLPDRALLPRRGP